MYFVDVEALVVSTVRDVNIHSNYVAWTSKAIGYADEHVFRDGRRNSSVERVESDVPKALHIIKGHKPQTQPPLPSGLEEITIRIAGLIDRSYRLINQAIPPAMKSAAAPSLRLPTVENTCITAKMEFFHNEGERKRLNTKLYSRLRASDPKIKPYISGSLLLTSQRSSLWPRSPTSSSASKMTNHINKNPTILAKDRYAVLNKGRLSDGSADQRPA